jgi:hypothetical protein
MPLRHARAARRRRPPPRALATLLAAAALSLAGCTEDTLYDGEEVTGPEVTVAPHTVSVSLAATPPRVEVGEALRVVVTGRGADEEPGRIAQLGATVLVMNTARTDTVVVPLGPQAVSPPAAGVVTREFPFTVAAAWVDRLRLPDTLAVEVHGWAVNAAGSCVAAVQDSVQKLPCADFRGSRVASRTRGLQARLAVVAGTTVALPGGAAIGDLVVHDATRRVFLSNKAANRIEVLEMPASGAPFFGQAVSVGSEPWGLALTVDGDPASAAGDTLLVANSGGISVSFVPLAAGALREDLSRRFQIPRARLYEYRQTIEIDSISGDTIRSFRVAYFTYADRPQFVAQDARRRLLYSAIGTLAAPVGTIRLAEWQPGWTAWDARFLFARGLQACCSPTSNRAIAAAGAADLAIANVDSIALEYATSGPFAGPTGRITLFDHRPGSLPGDPGRLIRNPIARDPIDAVREISALGSDVIAYPGHKWNVPQSIEMADTTFVAVSGDHRFIAFGELADTSAGRVVIWGAADAGDGSLSRVDDVDDIANNTADRITGIDLNENGSLGIARGEQASYFFGNDLRLQGLTRASGPGGAGVTLRRGTGGGSDLAFVGTTRSSIQVIETTHYQVVGEIPVRANIAGPLRAGAPLPGQTACPAEYGGGAPGCVVSRLYGVTAGGGVVVVEVFKEQLRSTTAAARRD